MNLNVQLLPCAQPRKGDFVGIMALKLKNTFTPVAEVKISKKAVKKSNRNKMEQYQDYFQANKRLAKMVPD